MKKRRISIITTVIFIFILTTGFGGFVYSQEEQVISEVSESVGGQISMDFKDADIKDVLRILSEKSGINIIAGSEVEGTVTLKLQNVVWDKALDMILKTEGYVYEQSGNIIRVTTLENLAEEELETKIFPLNYAKAESIAESLEEMFTERGNIQFDERTNQVLVTDVSSNVKKIGEIIEKLDTVTPQIQIEVRIIETTVGEDESLGIQWSTEVAVSGSKRPHSSPFTKWGPRGRMYPEPDADITYEGGFITEIDSPFSIKEDLPFAGGKEALNWSAFPAVGGGLGEEEYYQFGTLDFTGLQATLKMLISRTDTNVLSNPRITTLNNQLAKITVGTKWPVANYSYSEETGRWHISGWEYIEYGIILSVTPTVNKDGYITLDVKPEVSDVSGTVVFEGAEVPIITTKQAEVQVMIKDGQTLVIGGLMKDKLVKTTRKIPILGDIPLLGFLFSRKDTVVEKRDLLIFLTPIVLKEGRLDPVISEIAFEQEEIF